MLNFIFSTESCYSDDKWFIIYISFLIISDNYLSFSDILLLHSLHNLYLRCIQISSSTKLFLIFSYYCRFAVCQLQNILEMYTNQNYLQSMKIYALLKIFNKIKELKNSNKIINSIKEFLSMRRRKLCFFNLIYFLRIKI